MGTLCCSKGIAINIDDFTTTFPGGWGGKLSDPTQTPHTAVHNPTLGIAYSAIAKLIYNNSKDCCQLLASFEVLREISMDFLDAVDWLYGLDPPLGNFAFEMHRWSNAPGPGLTGNTFGQWNANIALACGNRKRLRDLVPNQVVPHLRELEIYIHEKMRIQWEGGGAAPTYDEFKVALAAASAWNWYRTFFGGATTAAESAAGVGTVTLASAVRSAGNRMVVRYLDTAL